MNYKKYFADRSLWEEKQIWICGLDIISFGVIGFLKAQGKEIAGIIDQSFMEEDIIWGFPVKPAAWIHEGDFSDPFFVITAFKEKHRRWYQRKISEYFGKHAFLTVSNATEIRIDVSGRCNLRCPSCHVGNHSEEDFSYRGRGFMTVEQFSEILDKVDQEFPENPAIYLFTLGEPLLNPYLPQMIRKIHEHGWLAVLSSNLSLDCDLEAILQEEPDVLKISVSGFSQEIYGTTHVGGNISLVKENMQKIYELINEKHFSTKVMAGYHIYSNNHREQLQMQELCRQMKFLFQPVPAMYFNLFKRSGRTPFTQKDIEFIKMYYDHPEAILQRPEKTEESENSVCRNQRDKLFIDYDGTVMLCELFHKDGFYKKYLEVSLDEIQAWRDNHWICRECKACNLNLT